MEICKKCIIPSSFPNVAVENGICTFCRLHEQSPIANKGLLGKDELKSILSSKTNGKYPCIVGLSGGKDSSYVLYCLVKKMGLKPLAAFFDNDFITDYAKENIQNLCNNLNVDLVIGKATTFRKKIIRENLHLSKYNIAFDACTNCENNLRSFIINEANNNKIPFIVYGATDYEDPYMMFLKPTTPTFRMIRSKERFEIIKTMKRMKWEYVDPLFLPMNLADKLKFYFHYLLSKYYVVRDNIKMKSPEGFRNLNPSMHVNFENKKVKSLYFFDYIKYDPEKMIDTLKSEMGWKGPFGKEARIDCKLGCFANYQHLVKTGITKDGFTLSVLVRNGLLNRSKAIRKEEIIQKELKAECKRVEEEIISKVKFYKALI